MKRSKLNKAITICLTIALGVFAFPLPSKAVEPSQKLEITPMVAAGQAHTVALRSDGTVWTWGYNNAGQLGDGTTNKRNKPRQVEGLPEIASIVASYYNTVALTRDGKVYTWGDNYYGQLGIGQDRNQLPYSNKPAQVETLSDIIAITTSGNHVIALGKNGQVYTWGSNDKGQLGLDSASTPSSNIPTEVSSISDVRSIATGTNHSAILNTSNDIYIWGDNSYAQFGNGSTLPEISSTPVGPVSLNDVVSIAAGGNNMAVLDNSGNLSTWGDNSFGQIGNGEQSSTRRVSTPYPVMQNVKKVAIGYQHMLALDNNGTVYAWGDNWNGQLGDETKVDKYSPTQVKDLNNITSIAAGQDHSLAVNKDGYVYAWGDNNAGQLGNGTNNDSNIPVQVVDETGNGYFNLNAPEKRDVTISANASIPGPTYSVNIPSTIDVGDIVQTSGEDPNKIKTTEFTMTASNLNNLFGAKVNVAISTTDGNFELADDSNNNLAYQVYSDVAGTALNNNATIAQFTTNGEKKGYIKIDQSDITQRGSYKGTLTFTLSVVSNQ